MDGLAGKRALITGGAAGIGRAIALKLAREGCDIALLDLDGPAAEATAAEIRALGRGAKATTGDVSDPASVHAGLAALDAGRAPIDILVNNAGIARLGSLLTISAKDWRDTFAVNVDGVFNVTRAVVPGMVERKRGAVVNLASWLGRRGHPAFSAYAATKFAVVGMTQSLAPEVAPHRRARQRRVSRPDRRHAHARRAGCHLGSRRPAARRRAGEVHPARPHRHARGCGQGGGVPRLRRGRLRHRRLLRRDGWDVDDVSLLPLPTEEWGEGIRPLRPA